MNCPWPLLIDMAGKPVAWARAGRKGGFSYTPAHTAKYANAIRLAAGEAMYGCPPADEPMIVNVTALIPVPASWSMKKQRAALEWKIWPTSRPDADNYLKLVLDAMNTIVFRDDSLVVEAKVAKRYDERPTLKICVLPISMAYGLAVEPDVSKVAA